jgi:hypothetical protein
VNPGCRRCRYRSTRMIETHPTDGAACVASLHPQPIATHTELMLMQSIEAFRFINSRSWVRILLQVVCLQETCVCQGLRRNSESHSVTRRMRSPLRCVAGTTGCSEWFAGRNSTATGGDSVTGSDFSFGSRAP